MWVNERVNKSCGQRVGDKNSWLNTNMRMGKFANGAKFGVDEKFRDYTIQATFSNQIE